MSGINSLSEAAAASGSMQLPVYDTSNGQPRKLSVTALQAFMQAELNFNPTGPLPLVSHTVAELASFAPSAYTGAVVYCPNGNAGSPCLAVSNGANWLRIALGAAVSP